jgi:penicillin-binding protein 1C
MRVATGGTALLLTLAAALAWQVHTTPAPPSFASLSARHPTSEGLLLARDGTPLHRLRVDLAVRRAAWVPLRAVAPLLQQYVVRLEDRRFASHSGVDWRAMGGAGLAR